MMLLEVDQLVLPLDIFPGNRTPSLTLNLIRLNMIWEAIILFWTLSLTLGDLY